MKHILNKKAISLLLILCVIMSIISFAIINSSAENTASIIIQGQNYTVNVGETFTYSFALDVSDATKLSSKKGYISAVDATLKYNTSMLEITNYSEVDMSGIFPVLGFAFVNSTNDGLQFVATATNGYKFVGENSYLVYVEFKVKGQGASSIKLNIKDMSDVAGENIVENSEKMKEYTVYEDTSLAKVETTEETIQTETETETESTALPTETETQVPITESTIEPTETTEPTETEPIETEAHIIIDGVQYDFTIGDSFIYTYYLDVTQATQDGKKLDILKT